MPLYIEKSGDWSGFTAPSQTDRQADFEIKSYSAPQKYKSEALSNFRALFLILNVGYLLIYL